MRRDNLTLLGLLLPAGAFFGAFFLLPLARLFLVGASGRDGLAAYATIVTDKNHFASLLATLALASATTVVTLIVSGLAGVFLQRNKFPANAALVAMLTLPLAFPGVVIGFMVIILAGRQGLIGDITRAITGEKLVVLEPCSEVSQRTLNYRAAVLRRAWPEAASALSAKSAFDAERLARQQNSKDSGE